MRAEVLDIHAGKRWKALLHTTASAGLERVVTGVCTLAQVPLILKALGEEGFGLWATLTSAVSLLVIADLGLGANLQNKLADAFGRDAPVEVRQHWHIAFRTLCGLCGIVFVLVASLAWWVDWGSLLRVEKPELRSETTAGMLIMLSTFLLGVPFSLISRLALATQMGWMVNVKNSILAVVMLAVVWVCQRLESGLLVFLWLASLLPVAANALLMPFVFRKLGWNRSDEVAGWQMRDAVHLVQQSWWFTLPQMGGIAIFMLPTVIISTVLGAAAVTPWNLMTRLFGLPVQIFSLILVPLWSAYTEANARKDVGWIQANFKRSLWLCFFFVALPTFSMVFFGRFFLSIWTGQEVARFDAGMVMAVSCYLAVQSFGGPLSTLLNAFGVIRGQAIYGTISAVLALSAMPFLVRHYGEIGVPLALLTIFSPVNLACSYYETQKLMRRLNLSQL